MTSAGGRGPAAVGGRHRLTLRLPYVHDSFDVRQRHQFDVFVGFEGAGGRLETDR